MVGGVSAAAKALRDNGALGAEADRSRAEALSGDHDHVPGVRQSRSA